MSKDLYFEQHEKDSAQWSVIMDNEVYTSLPREVRESFKNAVIIYPHEHEHLYENDIMYRMAYRKKKSASNELEEIKHLHRERLRKNFK